MKLGVFFRSGHGWTCIKKENGCSLGFVYITYYYIMVLSLINLLPWSITFYFFQPSWANLSRWSFHIFCSFVHVHPIWCMNMCVSMCFSAFLPRFVPPIKQQSQPPENRLVLGFLRFQAKKAKASPVTWPQELARCFFGVDQQILGGSSIGRIGTISWGKRGSQVEWAP